MGQAIEFVVVVVEVGLMVVEWVVEDRNFGEENSNLQGEKGFLSKVIVEARFSKGLEYSTFDCEHTEIENVTVTYL